MFVLVFWILIIECVTVEIKVVYGNDRVIITSPVHVKKLHRTRTIYKIIERPVDAGPRTDDRPRTTATGREPDRGRPLRGWYSGGGGGAVTVRDEDRGTAAGYRDRGHGAPRHRYQAVKPHGHHRQRKQQYGRGAAVVRVVGDHKHGHYADVMYVGDRTPRHRPAYRPVARRPHAVVPVRFPAVKAAAAPVVVPPPRRPHRDDDGGVGGYRVRENDADYRPYVVVGPASAGYASFAGAAESPNATSSSVSPQRQRQQQQQQRTAAVSHVYYTLDPVVPYDDVTRPSDE